MKRRRLCLLVFFFAPLFSLGLLEVIARGGAASFLGWMVSKPLLFLFNALWMLGVCLLLDFFRSYRLKIGLYLAFCLFCALLGVANYYKLTFRLEPVLLSDVTQLGDAMATVTGLDFHIDWGLVAGVCLPLCAAAVVCCCLVKQRRSKRRVLLPILGLCLVTAIPFLCTYERAGGGDRFDMADQARNDGCLYTAFAAENYRRSLMRLDYSQAETESAYRRLKADAPILSTEAEKPNIIFVLSESFTDEAILGQYLHLTDTLMPFYRSFTRECQTGRLYVPKVGGGTSETEFEVLTGLRSQYTVNPYSMGLPPMNSVASVLRQKGYTATAIHWYAGVYYNRYQNLPMEGFDNIFTTDTTDRDFEKIGMFVSDREHYKAIMAQMAQTAGRDFIFCLTMQNHGGYDYADFGQLYGADVPFTNALSPANQRNVANYCYLLRQSDAALAEWIAALKAFDEPTMVVFFGDHLAPLGMSAYEELGIPTSGDISHLTPYFIWSNVKRYTGSVNLSAYQLGAYALTQAGLCDDPFLCYVEKLRQAGLNEDATYDLLSYDALFGKQYAYQAAGLQPENKACQIGGQMDLTGFDAAQIGGSIYLRARLSQKDQSYRLRLNDRLLDVRRVPESDQPFTLQCVLSSYAGRVYNESQTLRYQSTDQLLARSGSLRYQTLPLWESGYELVRSNWYQRYAVFQSVQAFEAGQSTAATLDGQALDWQPVYGLSRAGQYAVQNGKVTIAIEKSALPGLTGKDAQAYLREHNALLYAFED